MRLEAPLTLTLGIVARTATLNDRCAVMHRLTVPSNLATAALRRNECMENMTCGDAVMCSNATWKPNASCPRIPTSMLWRGYERGTTQAHKMAVQNVHSWIHEAQCNISRGDRVWRPLNVLVLGGSVSHGSWNSPGAARYWGRGRRGNQVPMFDALVELMPSGGGWWGSVPLEDIMKVRGYPTTGMGPSYMASCLNKHVNDLFNGSRPDIAFLEYAVNDFGVRAESMMVLIMTLQRLGTAVVVIHHFAPAFINQSNVVTAENKHTAAARLLGASQVSLASAVGLGNRSAVSRVMHPCAFICAFAGDHVHPAGCGHRFLAQMAAVSLLDLMTLPRRVSSHNGACRAEPRKCSELDVDVATTSVSARTSARACTATQSAKCYSLTGAMMTWNLRPTNEFIPDANSSSWKLVDLKANGMYSVSHPGHKVYKFIWEGRAAGATARFAIECPRSSTALRIMYLKSPRLRYGDANISINNKRVGVLSGVAEKFTLFHKADFPLPDPPSEGNRLYDVDMTVLASARGLEQRGSSHGAFIGQGFGVNAIICLESEAQNVYYLEGSLRGAQDPRVVHYLMTHGKKEKL